jgi:hypothetical protein
MAQHAHTTGPFGFPCNSNGGTADTGVDLKYRILSNKS